MPRGVSKGVYNLLDVPDELPRVLRELLAENDLRRSKRTADQNVYWNGYAWAIQDVWHVFQHLYEEG